MIFRDRALDERFHQNGYVVVPLLSAGEVVELRKRFEHPADLEVLPFAASMMSSDLEYRRRASLAIREVAAPALEKILAEYRVAFCNFAVKSPGPTSGPVELHQDWTFVDENRFESVGMWCPLIDVGPDNGCLHVVRGSHRLGVGPRALYSALPCRDLIPIIEERFLQPLPLSAGEAVLFSQRLFHGSPPNRSHSVRVAAAAVLVPRESSLWYLHPLSDNGFELFEVDDDFYLRYKIGTRPADLVPFRTVKAAEEPITLERLLAVCEQTST